MKKFVKRILLFSLPMFLFGILLEISLRNIPNDYALKREYLDKNSDSIKVLFLGSSHAFYGINPEVLSQKSFNASNISQTLEYDFEILKKYKNNWSQLKCIVIPVSYFSLYGKLETGIESWRTKNYTIYYGMITSSKLSDYSEVLSNRFTVNLRRLGSYYIKGNSNISCSNLGGGLNYVVNEKRDLEETGKKSANRHKKSDDKYLKENVGVLISIAEFAKSKGAELFIYTPPAYYTYAKNLDKDQLNQTIGILESVSTRYNNVSYKNFLSDSTFSETDFFDADHLNEFGAYKLTRKIDTLINQKGNK